MYIGSEIHLSIKFDYFSCFLPLFKLIFGLLNQQQNAHGYYDKSLFKSNVVLLIKKNKNNNNNSKDKTCCIAQFANWKII